MIFVARYLSNYRALGLVILFTSGVLGLGSCGKATDQPQQDFPADVWAPGARNEPVQTVLGSVLHGYSEFLTPWHALEVQRLSTKAPEVLGDLRDSLLVATPSHFFVDLPASNQPRILRTALRRLQSHPDSPLHCEIFWSEGGELRSLAAIHMDAETTVVSEEWQNLELSIPLSAGKLEFVSRNPIPGNPNARPVQVAWQSPWVGSVKAAGTSNTPDVILLSIDTFRADALEHAPNLSALLERGRRWPQAVSPSNWTLPSYASLFTGLEPTEHGAGRGSFAPVASNEIEERKLTPINGNLPTLAQHFQEAGYATGMVHQSPMLESWTGFGRGFEQYLRVNDQNEIAISRAQDWWLANAGRPRFMVLQLMAPHLPYRLGSEPNPLDDLDLIEFFLRDHSYAQRSQYFDLSDEQKEVVRRRYYLEVEQVDRDLALMFDEYWPAGASGKSPIFAFHSDHGEELWDDGSFEHGHSFADAVVRVPIGLVWPGTIEPALVQSLVPAHGLGATLMDTAGIRHQWPRQMDLDLNKIESSMPFYRALTGGAVFHNEHRTDLPFRPQMTSGGLEAAISQEKMRMLEELGYLAAKDLRDH
ncbi:MAG: sulfatase-like hydrolase/transferase [Planctomycetes bacterium]|nr:sulfatase-like hydrolase/transferase [Planctomycetota bacterium]